MAAFDEDRLACVDGYFDCIESTRHGRRRLSKSIVQAYLAGLNLNPAARDLALAARKSIIPLGHPAFDGLRRFVRDLYDAAAAAP